jgi:uncharacterized protein YkwD
MTNDDGSTWTETYSPPSQITWAPESQKFISGAHDTSYVLTSTDTAGNSFVTTTKTSEAACTPAADDYKQSALNLHNKYRAQHKANPVVWDDDLACVAQRQANTCIWEHLTYCSPIEFISHS